MWQCWQVAALTRGTARVWAGREETRLNEDMWQTKKRCGGWPDRRRQCATHPGPSLTPILEAIKECGDTEH